jgi:hypothetical protein
MPHTSGSASPIERRDDQRAEQPDERDESEDQQIVAAQSPDEPEHAARIQRLHDCAGRALHRDDRRQGRGDRDESARARRLPTQ